LYIAADHRVQRIVAHADTNQIPLRSAKKNMSHKHARMESKFVTQTPTGQNQHKDAFITFVTQTCHTDSSRHVTRHVNKILRESTDIKHAKMKSKLVTQTPIGPRHTAGCITFVTQTRKLNLTHRREN